MLAQLKALAPMFRGFLQNLDIEEATVTADGLSLELAALQEHLVKNGCELRRFREKKSGFTGYLVVKKGEPRLIPRPEPKAATAT